MVGPNAGRSGNALFWALPYSPTLFSPLCQPRPLASTWDGFIFTYRLSGIITTAITWLAGTRRGTGPNDVSRSGGDSPAARGRYATEQADREARAETNAEALENCTGLAPGVTNLPIDQIRQTVHPTADQEAALDNLSSASSQAGEIIKSSCPTSVPLTPIGRLDAAEQRLDTTIKAIRMVLLPLQRFYEMLSDEQRVRFSAMKRSTEGARSPSNMAEYVLLRCASCRILSVISLFPSYFPPTWGPPGTRGGVAWTCCLFFGSFP
jgi:hypothetical protein